jgi:hypothetical protein
LSGLAFGWKKQNGGQINRFKTGFYHLKAGKKNRPRDRHSNLGRSGFRMSTVKGNERGNKDSIQFNRRVLFQ